MRRLPMFGLRVLLLLTLPALALAQADTWPFGEVRAKRDLYNLGALGAKASDEVKGEPERAGEGRRTVTRDPAADGPDIGPERLRIEILYPGGPAALAGLQVGDVLVGAGGKKFTKGSFQPLAGALKKALSSKGETAVVKLLVERDGKAVKLEAEVPTIGKTFAKPTSDKGRLPVVERSLDWLAERQIDSGGFPETLGGSTGAVVATSMAGLAWIAGGSDLTQGKHQENLRKAWKFVVDNVGKRGLEIQSSSNWNQENWGWVHGAIFLGELYAHSPEAGLLEDLGKFQIGLEQKIEVSGGYAHGIGGPNALGYVELNIMTGLALSGFGMLQRAGIEPREEIIEKAIEYLEASSSGGSVGYSTSPGQIGQGNIGRGAIAWIAYRNLGRGKSKMGKALGGYVKANVDAYMDGHASLMQHILFAGVAAQASGGGVEKAYWSAIERDYLLAMGPDGSFQPRPWGESLAMASNSDVSFGDVWTTACWTIVLACKPDKDGTRGLPTWLAK